MKKAVVLGGVVVLAAGAAFPYLAGSQAQQAFDGGLVEANGVLIDQGVPMAMKLLSYDKGFSHSQAVVRMQLSLPEGIAKEAAAESLCMDFDVAISHGHGQLLQGSWMTSRATVVPPEKQTECGLAEIIAAKPDFAEFYSQQFGVQGPLEVTTRLPLAGGLVSDIHFKPVSLDTEIDGGRLLINAAPITGQMVADNDFSNVQMVMNWDGLKLKANEQNQQVEMNLGALVMKSEQRKLMEHLAAGTGAYEFAGLQVTVVKPGHAQAMSAGRVLASATFSESSEAFMDYDLQFSFEDVVIDQQDLGSMKFAMALRNLEKVSLNNFLGLMKQVNRQLFASGQSLDQAQALQQVMVEQGAAFQENVVKILGDAKLVVAPIEYRLQDAVATINGNAELVGLKDVPMDQLMAQPQMMTGMVKLDLDGELSQSMVQSVTRIVAALQGQKQGLSEQQQAALAAQMTGQFEQMSQMWVQQGLLVQDDQAKAYRVKLSMANGMPTVNGVPFPMGGAN